MGSNVRLTCRVRESTFEDKNEVGFANLKHIHVSRLFDASPEEFFDFYFAPNVIEAGHVRASILTKALEYLKTHPGKKLIISGHYGESQLKELREKAKELQIAIAIEREAYFRAVTFKEKTVGNFLEGKFLLLKSTVEDSLKFSGIPANTTPATYWERWFKAFFTETLLSGLKVQNESRFFDFLREAARYTGRPVNWTKVGEAASVSQATSRRWCAHLERLGVIDLIEPVGVAGKRRFVKRKKLFWRAPGLAIWLTRLDVNDKKTLKFYGLNAIYLSLKDAYPNATFSYVLDTNGIEIPVRIENAGQKYGIFCLADASEKPYFLRHTQTYAKMGLVDHSICHKLYIEKKN